MRIQLRALALGALLALNPTASGDQIAPGYSSSLLPNPQGATRTLSNGDVIAYDGMTVARYDAAGVLLQTLFTLPPNVFGGCFAVDPSETVALVGESSFGDLFAVDLVSGGGALLGNLAGNFDAVFEDGDTALVSAATCGFGCGNDLVRVELAGGSPVTLASVGGASGPLALAPDGDLLYATVSADFPPPAGFSDVLRFDAALLTGAPVLTEGDADVVLAGLDGAFSMAVDPGLGRVFLAENDFATGDNRLHAIRLANGADEVLVEGDLFSSLGNLEFLPGPGPGVVLGFQPATAGTLLYNRTDFFTFDERRALEPARPALTLSGAGTSGTGPVDVGITGAPAGGDALLLWCPLANFQPTEVSLSVAGLPLLHLGLDLGTIQVVDVLIPIDAAGEATVRFQNGQGVTDVLAVQALVRDDGGALVGTTTADFL